MALVSDEEERSAYGEKVEPGWIFNSCTKQYHEPGMDTLLPRVTESQPKYTFEIFNQSRECERIYTSGHGLREFLRYLKDSNISQYPETTTILKPLTTTLPVSYASAVKFEGPQDNRTCEFKLNISLVHTTFSSAEPKTFDDVSKMKCDVSVAGEKRTKDITEYEECVPKLSRQEVSSSLTISGRESTVVSKSVATNIQNSSSQKSIYSLDNVSSEKQNKVSQNKTIHSEEFINESLQSSSDTNFKVPDAGQGKIDNHQGTSEGLTARLPSTTNITMQKSSNVVSSLKKSYLPQTNDLPDTHLSGYNTRSQKKKYHDDSVVELPSGKMTDKKLNRTSDWSDSVGTDNQMTKEKNTIHLKGTNVTQMTNEKDIMYPKETNASQMTEEKDTIHPKGTNVSQMIEEKYTMYPKGTNVTQIKDKDTIHPNITSVSQMTKDKDTIHPKGTSITCPVSYQSEINPIKEAGQTLHTMSSNNHICDMSSSLLQPIEEGEICGMTRKYYGIKSVQKEKVIILLGAAGCGKTTLVNFIANYFQGNKKANGELIHVARCCNNIDSITKIITAYTFCNDKEHTPITIIDTPGLNDSSGAEIRDHVLSLKTFLANIVSHNIEIHTIGFVAQAHLVRLTSSERLVMDYISTVFGETCGDHIITFVTFSDNQENPPIVEAMKNYGVNCKLFLKFNNSVLTIKKGDDVDELDRAYWRIGHKSWKKCMKALEEQLPLSIHTMETLQNNVYVSQVWEKPIKVDVTSDVKVAPGWTYSMVLKTFFPPDHPNKIQIESDTIVLEICFEPQFVWEDSAPLQSWLKDQAVKVDPDQVLIANGNRISKVKYTNVQHHLFNSVVSSVKEKYSVQMAIVISQRVDKTVHKKISSLATFSNEEEIPEEISKIFMQGYIIENYNTTEFRSLRECMEMFHTLLKSSDKGTTRTAYIELQQPAFGTTLEIRESSDKLQGTEYCHTSATHNNPDAVNEKDVYTGTGMTTTSTMYSGQLGKKSLGTVKDVSVARMGEASSQVVSPQPKNIEYEDIGDSKKDQDTHNTQYSSTITTLPRQLCQKNDPLHNRTISAAAAAGGGGGVSGYSDGKHFSKSSLRGKEPGNSNDREWGGNVSREKEQIECKHKEQSIAQSIIESCKIELSSLTEDTQVEKISVMEEKKVSSQQNGNEKTTKTNNKMKKEQTKRSRSASRPTTSLNEYDELESFRQTSTHQKPSRTEPHYRERNGDTDRHRHKDNKEIISDKSKNTSKSARERSRVTLEEASNSSSSLDTQKPSLLGYQTTKAGKGKCKKPNMLHPIDSTNAQGIVWNYYGVHKSKGKVLLLIGNAQSGKTTLVNFIANYLKGNQEMDEFIVLDNFSSKYGPIATTLITAHTFCFSENDTPVTVIDTPGLSDCDGKEREAIVQTLKTLFKSTNFSLHAIGLVFPANLVHLTSSERHMIEYIITHFGEAVVDHCITFITSADNLQTPQAVDVLKSHGVKSKMVLQLNNSIFSLGTKDVSEFDRIYWKKGMKSLKKCFLHLENISHIAVNPLKVAQLEAYSVTVTEASMKNLRKTLTYLIKLLQLSQDLTGENFTMCEKVWEAVTVVQRVLSNNGKVSQGVEETLVFQAQQVANELSFPPDCLVQFLSLSKSRGLLSAGSAIIKSLAPLYDDINNTSTVHTSAGINPGNQYCQMCREYHVMKRQVESSWYPRFPGWSSNEKDIIYKCSQCKCNGFTHIEYKQEPESLNLNLDWVLQHTKDVINDTLEKLSLPGHFMPPQTFLNYIDMVQNYNNHKFIEELKNLK
ncbi:hypothetical protein Pmani_013753 [Petrolisthes manimaculis]|uniref:AAA+ ATPase domain-containing protein n=1 Tax=Petrolisthes manimaculis TaxID=1843537 RepID=A0AAE1PV02_9EUCA|nr:hypothetical protein Pmani_013753 [Petrolisthes manimaculis]